MKKLEENIMKIVVLFLFLVLPISALGQQYLWSTVQGNEMRYIQLNSVVKEVLNFYDQYKVYYDYSGYSKDNFIKHFDYGFDNWEWLTNIDTVTVFALRSNAGRGSVVIVMCISKINVNAVIFSNTYEPDCIMTSSYERDKFANWFKTLLN
jgi:hypothetical protein